MINLVIADDNGGRRTGIDRRELFYAAYLPERRSEEDRRSGVDRRSLVERSSDDLLTKDLRNFFKVWFDNYFAADLSNAGSLNTWYSSGTFKFG